MDYITQCKITNCNDYVFAKEMCQKHYWRVRRHGNAETVKHIQGQDRTSHELYSTYNSMMQRCNNPKHKHYSYYGGRGIKVCNRWSGQNGLTNFIADMHPRPKNMTLDRRNNNKGYSPNNCHWVTRSEQQYNQRLGRTNTSGHKGVHYYQGNKSKPWSAYVYVNKKRKHLGYFETIEQAVSARKKAEIDIN